MDLLSQLNMQVGSGRDLLQLGLRASDLRFGCTVGVGACGLEDMWGWGAWCWRGAPWF